MSALHEWYFVTEGPDKYKTSYNVTLNRDNPDLLVLIADTLWPEENSIRLYDLDGIKKLRQILTEIENSLKES